VVTIDAISKGEMVIISSHPSAYPICGHGGLFGDGFSPIAQDGVETNIVSNSRGSTNNTPAPKVLGGKNELLFAHCMITPSPFSVYRRAQPDLGRGSELRRPFWEKIDRNSFICQAPLSHGSIFQQRGFADSRREIGGD
jgi:hypothetical protein